MPFVVLAIQVAAPAKWARTLSDRTRVPRVPGQPLNWIVAVPDLMPALLTRWRDDPGGTYRSWFLWEERVKNFRSIRRGIQQVVAEIQAGTFGVAYRGFFLETAVHCIAEQRQPPHHRNGSEVEVSCTSGSLGSSTIT